MKNTLILLALLYLAAVCSGEVRLRHKRSLETEDNEVVVITSPRPGPSVPSYSHDAFDFNFNENTGAFSLGGQLPTLCCHHGVHSMPSFADLFEQMQKRFEEMTRAMTSSMGNSNFTINSKDYPDGYNKTETEVIEMGGKKYLKKTTVIKKGGDTTGIFIKSTTYEPYVEDTVTGEGSSESTPESMSPSEADPISPESTDSVSPTVAPESGLEREELSTASSNN